MNKKSLNGFIGILSCFLLLNISGCSLSTVHRYSKETQYQQPSPPKPDETLLYLFRENTIVGGALGLTFVADDTVVAALEFGSYTYVKLPATKPYELVAVWHEKFDQPKYHFRITPSPGETLYLMFNKTLGSRGEGLNLIDKETAETFIKTKEYDYRKLNVQGEKIGVSYNEYFDKLIAGDKNLPVIDNEKIVSKRPFHEHY